MLIVATTTITNGRNQQSIHTASNQFHLITSLSCYEHLYCEYFICILIDNYCTTTDSSV